MVVLGLDLSLRQSGCVILAPGQKPKSAIFGYELPELYSSKVKGGPKARLPERARLDRIITIAKQVLAFAKAGRITHAFVENYAFGSGFREHQMGELGGVIKTQLYVALGIVPEPVTVSSARKLMCGKIPAKADKKKFVQQFLDARAISFETPDEYDAYVIANYGMAKLNLEAIKSEEK